MTTVAERLKAISGLTNATVAAMLLAAGTGSTMAECLVSYSGLSSGTVIEHLLVDAINRQFDDKVLYVTDSIKPFIVFTDTKPVYIFTVEDRLFAFTSKSDKHSLDSRSELLLSNIDFDEIYVINSNSDIRCISSTTDIFASDLSSVIYAYTSYINNNVVIRDNDVVVLNSQNELFTKLVTEPVTIHKLN